MRLIRRQSAQRKFRALEDARIILEALSDGTPGPYEGYRQVYGIYLNTSGALEELKPLFRLRGVVPDGTFSVDDEFRRVVIAAAAQWLHDHPRG